MEKPNKTKLLLVAGVILILLFTVWAMFLRRPPMMPGMGQMPVPEIELTMPIQQDVIEYAEFTGTTQAFEHVDIRARVKGFLNTINFEDGSLVKQGDLLFEIEPDLYIARKAQAEALLNAAKAEVDRTKSDLERVTKAIESNAVSQQELTAKQAGYDMAYASLLAAKAQLKTAELDLGYSKIYSPIDGIISQNMVDKGNLVGASENTHLATIVNVKPLYIYFDISESFFLKRLDNLKSDGSDLNIFRFALAGQKDFDKKAVIDYIANTVDQSTGTISIRGVYDNPEGDLLPGMYVKIKIPVGIRKNAILVNDRAIRTDLGGKYLLSIDRNNIVIRKPIRAGQAVDGMRVVTKGLDLNQGYIETGFQNLFPGMDMSPPSTEPGK